MKTVSKEMCPLPFVSAGYSLPVSITAGLVNMSIDPLFALTLWLIIFLFDCDIFVIKIGQCLLSTKILLYYWAYFNQT